MSRSTSATTTNTGASKGLPHIMEDDPATARNTTESSGMQTTPTQVDGEDKATADNTIERAISAKKKDVEAGTSGSDPTSVQAGTFKGKVDPFANTCEGGVDYKCMAWW